MSQANFSDDATSVVKAIQNGVVTDTIIVDGETFTTRPVFIPPVAPNTARLEVSTLDGLIEYLNENVDRHAAVGLMVVAGDPRSVTVLGQIGGAKETRVNWLEAEYTVDAFPFGKFISHEEFVVAAQCLLVDDAGDIRQLLTYIGNLTAAQITTSTDDGVSQTVVVESGVRKSAVELPNPVNLAPRRTFAEIEQPSSPFVLRVRQTRDGQMPEIALFEADGGLWRIEAIKRIKKYIAENLNEDLQIPVIG